MVVSQIDLLSAWYPLEDIERVEVKKQTVTIVAQPGATAWIPRGQQGALQSWGSRTGVPVEECTKRKGGLWNRLLGR